MKKRPERKRMTPLLYVQQPHLKHPKAKMQEHFKYQEIQEPINIPEKPEDIKEHKEPVNPEKKIIKGKNIQGNKTVSQKIEVKKQDTNKKKKEFEQGEGTKESNFKQMIEEKKNHLQGFKMDNLEENTSGDSQDTKNRKNTWKNEEETNKKQTSQKRTPFQEQSLDDKLRDLQRSPVTVVKIRYEFITPKETYLGYFISQKNGILTIQDLKKGKKIQTIPLESLIDIKMVGI